MTDFDRLAMLKVDLGITSEAYDERLAQYIEMAKSRLTRLGITLADTLDDDTLIIQYAAWTWKNRDQNIGIPRWLSYAINNRVFSEHMQEDTSETETETETEETDAETDSDAETETETETDTETETGTEDSDANG